MGFRYGMALSAVVSLVVSGCATQSPDSPGGAQALPREAPARAAAREVPKVRVVLDCGACEVKPGIAELIVEGYEMAVSGAQAKIVAQREALVVIKEYSARDDAARFMLGAFAGKDEIKAAVAYQEKTFMVEDYYVNAWLGIDHLARKIGELVFEGVSQ
jgi:hypothetical protein